MSKYQTIVRINDEDIFKYVYAQSAWYCAHHNSASIITKDYEKMLLVKLEEGVANIAQRFAGYLSSYSYNPNNVIRNIELVFKFNKQPTELFTQALKQNIISLLAHFILMRMYAEVEETGNKSLYLIFEKEWRRYNSKILLAVSFDLL